MKIFLKILICFLCLQNIGFCDILFEENFDNQKDFSPEQRTGGTVYTVTQNDVEMPIGWDSLYMEGSAYINKGENTVNIDSRNYRGASGKAYTMYTEMDRNCGAWCSDGLMGFPLPGGETGYDEIYIRYYVKFQPNYRFRESYHGGVGLKMLHVAHHKDTDSYVAFHDPLENKPRNFFKIYFFYNGSGNSGPMGNPTFSQYTGGTNPTYSGTMENPHGYFPGGGYGSDGTTMYDNVTQYRSHLINEYGSDVIITDNLEGETQYTTNNFPHGMFGDGEWHMWEWRLKMNSAEGVTDGICTFWQDGIQVYHAEDIAWCMDGGGDPAERRWNFVWIGGNNNNIYDENPANEEEQWYAIDDIVVSTTRLPSNYIVTTGPADRNQSQNSRKRKIRNATCFGVKM